MAYALFDFDDGDGHLMAGYRYAGWRAFIYRLGGRHCVYCEQVEPPKP